MLISQPNNLIKDGKNLIPSIAICYNIIYPVLIIIAIVISAIYEDCVMVQETTLNPTGDCLVLSYPSAVLNLFGKIPEDILLSYTMNGLQITLNTTVDVRPVNSKILISRSYNPKGFRYCDNLTIQLDPYYTSYESSFANDYIINSQGGYDLLITKYRNIKINMTLSCEESVMQFQVQYDPDLRRVRTSFSNISSIGMIIIMSTRLISKTIVTSMRSYGISFDDMSYLCGKLVCTDRFVLFGSLLGYIGGLMMILEVLIRNLACLYRNKGDV